MLPDYLPQGLENGRTRNLMALIEPDFDIVDIANRLAKINRFAGATRFPLSVATHSVVVSYLAPKGLELVGLLHDISESFGIGDMIRPVKQISPAFKELELAIEKQLEVPFPCLKDIALIKQADNRATAIEAYIHRGEWPDWSKPEEGGFVGYDYPLNAHESRLTYTFYEGELSWQMSAAAFVLRYNQLVNR